MERVDGHDRADDPDDEDDHGSPERPAAEVGGATQAGERHALGEQERGGSQPPGQVGRWDRPTGGVGHGQQGQLDEGGNVRVRIVISSDGRVTSIDVVQSSGSGVLDAAALAVFRNARLPPSFLNL